MTAMGEPDWPFIGTEALVAGHVSRRTLRSQHELVYRNVYLRRGHQLTAVSRAMAAWLWSGRTAIVAGLSAAALHGSRWIDPVLPAELNRAEACPTVGIVIRREALLAGESCVVRGIPATTPARTAFDLGRRKGLTAAVIYLDALANATGLTPRAVGALAARHPGARGSVRLRRVIELMDCGAESPQETRTRLLLVRSIDRYAELAALGWIIIRVSSNLLRYRPEVVIARIRDALRAAGCPWVAEYGLNARFS